MKKELPEHLKNLAKEINSNPEKKKIFDAMVNKKLQYYVNEIDYDSISKIGA